MVRVALVGDFSVMSENSENPATHEPVADSAPVPTDVSPRRRPGVYLGAILGIALVVLLVDQLSKVWAEGALVVGEPARPLLGDVIGLRLIYNSGAALSFGAGMTWVLTLLSAVVVVFIAFSARRIRSVPWAVALGLVLGGALGNLGDRLFRAPGFPEGHVVDFIDYGPFIGNIADIAIVVAAVIIAVLALTGLGPDGVRAGSSPDGTTTTTTTAETDAASSATPDPDETSPVDVVPPVASVDDERSS